MGHILNLERLKNEDSNLIGEGMGFQRIRRITGYLVGTTERWNDAKREELKDRVKHEASKYTE